MTDKPAESEWRTGKPPDCGYYLAAWWRGKWTVSELWFNPDSGWWSTRSYFPFKYARYNLAGAVPEPITVKAWRPLPEYPEEVPDGQAR